MIINLGLILLIILIIVNYKCRCNNIVDGDYKIVDRINAKDVMNHDHKIKQSIISEKTKHNEKNNNDLKINSVEQTSVRD